MQIEYDGQKEEAYSLTIYKTHAQEILNGSKTVEIRTYSNKNCALFLDPEKAAQNAKARKEGRLSDLVWPMKDIFAIHFYDRGGRYELNVLLDYCGVACMCEEDIKMLGDRFGFHVAAVRQHAQGRQAVVLLVPRLRHRGQPRALNEKC